MDDNLNELDGLINNLIAEKLVCPYLPDCLYYRICNHPDHNSLYYATHFCGDKFVLCQVYDSRSGDQATTPRSSYTEPHTLRISTDDSET